MKETDNKISNKNTNNDKRLIYIIIISITIVSSVGIFSYSTYKKEQLKQKQEIKLFEKQEQKNVQRQNNLNNCINQAKTERTNLWNSNCTKQSDGRCTINSNNGISNWIEQRYQQDLNSCYQLYGN